MRKGRPALAAARPVTYMIFDVLGLNGADLVSRPYRSRRETLDKLDLNGDHWLTPPMFADGPATRAAAEEYELEGLMAKRLNSVYRPGSRSSDWIKIKIDTDRRVRRRRLAPGRAYPRSSSHWSARRRRTASPTADGSAAGFPAHPNARCCPRCEPLVVDRSPFATDIPKLETRGATWVRPELVIEVKYGQQTPDGRLRFPRFLRIRPDLTAAEVDTAEAVDDA